MTCGIYILYYETDDLQYYIGKSINIEGRYRDHCSDLTGLHHTNKKLLNGYKLNNSLPTLDVLEVLPINDTILYDREVHWISTFNSFKDGMNSTPGGEGVGFGDMHPSSVYSNKQLIDLITFMYNNHTQTFKEVALNTGIDIDTIKTLVSGGSHRWLEKEIPKEYLFILSLSGTRKTGTQIGVQRGETSGNSKYSNKQIIESFLLICTGASYQSITTITQVHLATLESIRAGRCHTWLASDYPLEYATMSKLPAKGLKIWDDVISPEGIIHQITMPSKFAKDHNLDVSAFSKLLRGKIPRVKGYTLAPKPQ